MLTRALARSPLLALGCLVALALLAGCDDASEAPLRTTGLAELDAVIEAVEARDVDAVLALARFRALPCTRATGQGGPPQCAEREPAGTTVEVFEYHVCHVEWRPRGTLRPLLLELLETHWQRYAAFEAPPAYAPIAVAGRQSEERRRYVAVVEAEPPRTVGAGLAMVVEDGRIVALHRTCGAGEPASALVPPGQESFLLPPAEESAEQE